MAMLLVQNLFSLSLSLLHTLSFWIMENGNACCLCSEYGLILQTFVCLFVVMNTKFCSFNREEVEKRMGDENCDYK